MYVLFLVILVRFLSPPYFFATEPIAGECLLKMALSAIGLSFRPTEETKSKRPGIATCITCIMLCKLVLYLSIQLHNMCHEMDSGLTDVFLNALADLL